MKILLTGYLSKNMRVFILLILSETLENHLLIEYDDHYFCLKKGDTFNHRKCLLFLNQYLNQQNQVLSRFLQGIIIRQNDIQAREQNQGYAFCKFRNKNQKSGL